MEAGGSRWKILRCSGNIWVRELSYNQCCYGIWISWTKCEKISIIEASYFNITLIPDSLSISTSFFCIWEHIEIFFDLYFYFCRIVSVKEMKSDLVHWFDIGYWPVVCALLKFSVMAKGETRNELNRKIILLHHTYNSQGHERTCNLLSEKQERGYP